MYSPSSLLMECLADFVEAAGFHLEPAGGGGDHVGLVGVGGASECFVFEVGMLLQDFVLVAVFRQLHRVVGEVERDEAELRDDAAFRLVDVGGDEDAVELVHLGGDAFDRHVEAGGEQLGLLIHDFELFVDLHLVAEHVRYVGDVGQVLVQKLLEEVEGFVVLEEGEAVRLLLRRDLGAAQHEDVAVVRVVLGEPAVAGAVMVGDADHVDALPLRFLNDEVGRHVQLTARRQQRVVVQICLEDVHGGLLVNQLVNGAGGLEGLGVGAKNRNALVDSLFQHILFGLVALYEEDGGELLEGSDGQHVLMGLEGNPHLAFAGKAHHIAQQVGRVTALDFTIQVLLSAKDGQVHFFY